MTLAVAIVGSISNGDGRPEFPGGKLPPYFLPPFEQALSALDIRTTRCSFRQFSNTESRFDAALFVYREEYALRRLDLWNDIQRAAEAAEGRRTLVIHSPRIGRIVSNKTLTHQTLSASGVPMPRIIADRSVALFNVFSNENTGSHTPVAVISPGQLLRSDRFNTEWIDTAHEYRGRRYYVALRALCVGRHCLSTYVRARPVEQGDPSVHASDTPLDAGLLNFLHEQIVVPRSSAISSLCAQIGEVLGLGFYAHDILPEHSTGRVLVCETGFKLHDAQYRNRFLSLRGQLADDDCLSDDFPRRSAECFAKELRKLISS